MAVFVFNGKERMKEMNPLNRSSHLQNKTVHYKLFCTHIMSTYNRINRDDQGFNKKKTNPYRIVERGSKVILGFFILSSRH